MLTFTEKNKTMRKVFGPALFVLAIFIALSACNNQATNDDGDNNMETMVEDTTPINELADFRFSYTIANLPSPFQVLDEFARSGLPINTSLLNPSSNAENYHSLNKLAFNYGVYGVDLGYAVVNERTPEILMYYPTVRDISQQLDIGESFDKFAIRFEENNENRDSLAKILDEAYAATDDYLRNNQRLKVASLILAGSWLECQHICVNLLKGVERNASNEILYQRVYEQRLHLENVINILTEFKDDAEIAAVISEMSTLLEHYKKATDPSEINKEFLNGLSTGISNVRGKVIG